VNEEGSSLKIEEPLQTTRLDPNFKFEVAKIPGGESLRYCFQCGKCSATCPLRRFTDAYNPVKIVRATLLGLRNVVLSSDEIWLCAVCYSCTERCPQGVRLTDVIRAIRNLAVQKEHIHPFYAAQGHAIATHGRVFDAEEEAVVNDLRSTMDLPPLSPVNPDEISIILRSIAAK
jgi:heterodisulfide reductase subunit C